MRPCTRCSGKGTNAGSNRKRSGRCTRCKGTRQVKRFGSTAVHRFLWSIAGEAMERRAQEKVESAKQKAGYPES
jgi:DnaJ-class molecular chaperone